MSDQEMRFDDQGRDRDRRRARHRPGPRARAGRARREGRRQRPRQLALRRRGRPRPPPRPSWTRSSPPAARPSPTRATSPPRTAPPRSSPPRSTHFGRLDIVVNNAGNLAPDDMPSLEPDVLESAPRDPRRRVVQRDARRLAAHGRARLRTRRHDLVDRPVRRPIPHCLLHREGRCDVTRALAGSFGRRARDQGQPPCSRGGDEDGH